jgi:hypothetical protein
MSRPRRARGPCPGSSPGRPGHPALTCHGIALMACLAFALLGSLALGPSAAAVGQSTTAVGAVIAGDDRDCKPWEDFCRDDRDKCFPWEDFCKDDRDCKPWEDFCKDDRDCKPWEDFCRDDRDKCFPWEDFCKDRDKKCRPFFRCDDDLRAVPRSRFALLS